MKIRREHIYLLMIATTILVPSGLLSACNLPQPAEEARANVALAVSATLTAEAPTQTEVTNPEPSPEPTLSLGHVSGQICYPSEPPLPPLTIYFEEINTQSLHTLEHTNGTGVYEIDLPDGSYVAYAWREGYDLGGAYSAAVPCGLSVNCSDHSLLPFQVSAGQMINDIDICDWYGSPGDVPEPPVQPDSIAPPATPTATPPPDGMSLNCDGTYQRVRIVDQGITGKTISVDAWDGISWANVWNMSSGDPNLKQLMDEAGYYEFLSCQNLIIVPFRHSNPQVFYELGIHVWNGSGLTQVYYNEGDYGEWEKIGDRIRFREASKLGTVNNGPLGPCEWVTLEHTWDGVDFIQTGSAVDLIPNCTVTLP
jgi:hypothetical protein